jgi:hypothetical protein
MSINLTLMAWVDSPVKGKKRIYERFDLFQTPSEITRAALASGDPQQFYVDWARQFEEVDTRKVPQYAPTDVFCKGAVVWYETYNPVKVHLRELDEWLADHEGWRVEWSCI